MGGAHRAPTGLLAMAVMAPGGRDESACCDGNSGSGLYPLPCYRGRHDAQTRHYPARASVRACSSAVRASVLQHCGGARRQVGPQPSNNNPPFNTLQHTQPYTVMMSVMRE